MIKSAGATGVFHRGVEHNGTWVVQSTKQYTKDLYKIKIENATTDQISDDNKGVYTNLNSYEKPIKRVMANQQDYLYTHHMSIETIAYFKRRGYVSIFYHNKNGEVVTKQFKYNEFIKILNNKYFYIIDNILSDVTNL
jgi:hypothetical protein